MTKKLKKSVKTSCCAGGEKAVKEMVKERYNDAVSAGCCCGSGKISNKLYSIMSEDYSRMKGYVPDADLGFGCGVPTRYAGIKRGDTVVDLGSGAGNDCFVARAETGKSGRIIGVDFAPAMIAKAVKNAKKLGVKNVEFRRGDIENMPVAKNTADVVISNCVLNLLPKKNKIFHEIKRILKPGGHFCVSDIVLEGTLPARLRETAAMYVGCVAGAIQKKEYLNEISKAGFKNIKVVKERKVEIPDNACPPELDAKTIKNFKNGSCKILSVTVTGVKPY